MEMSIPLRSVYLERKAVVTEVYVIICTVGRKAFLYAGAGGGPLDQCLRQRRARLLAMPEIREAVANERRAPEMQIVSIQECAGLTEIYLAERWWIRRLQQSFPNVLNGNAGGRLVFGTWLFQLGADCVEGFLRLSQHPANTQRLGYQELQKRIEQYGWSLWRALRVERGARRPDQAQPRGGERIRAMARRSTAERRQFERRMQARWAKTEASIRSLIASMQQRH